MNLPKLYEVLQDPAYKDMLDADIASDLNTAEVSVLKTSYLDACVSKRTLDSLLGPTKTTWILAAIESQGTPESARYLEYLNEIGGSYPGIDSRVPEFAVMVDTLVAAAESTAGESGPAVTAADGELLKDYAYTTITKAEQLGLSTVTSAYIVKARALNDPA